MRLFHVILFTVSLTQIFLLNGQENIFSTVKGTLLTYNDNENIEFKGRETVYSSKQNLQELIAQADEVPVEKSSIHKSESVSQAHIYTLPGIIGRKDGVWMGSDNLYNLPSELGLVVDLVKPEGKEVPVNVEEIKKIIETTLDKYRIKIHPGHASLEKPLPFLHLLIMVLPVERNNYVVSAEGRLFEEILNTRVNLEKGIFWQAITWEKEDLFFVSKDKLHDQLEHSFLGIANSFGERFKFFRDLKNSKKER